MTIDDELIYELIRPERDGMVGKEGLIVRIVGTRKVDYSLEEPKAYRRYYRDVFSPVAEVVRITPDLIVTLLGTKEILNKYVAVELENDVHWDFGQSLRQVKKYKEEYDDTRVIIPEIFEKFAPLYVHEGFRVWLWKAKRKWQCLRCGTISKKEGPFPPKCKGKNCNAKNLNDFRLVGLEDVEIEEYTH